MGSIGDGDSLIQLIHSVDPMAPSIGILYVIALMDANDEIYIFLWHFSNAILTLVPTFRNIQLTISTNTSF